MVQIPSSVHGTATAGRCHRSRYGRVLDARCRRPARSATASLTAFGKRLSEEFAPRGVRVNIVSPRVVGTSPWRDPDGFGGKVAAAYSVGHYEFLVAISE